MFECHLDTNLLVTSLSSYNKLNKEKECQLNLDAATGVCTTVNKILVMKLRTLTDEEVLKEYFNINRRLHSVVFFGALRSCGIVSSEADAYYESIIHIVPVIEWKFYIFLVFKCQWSCHFFECVQKLPVDVLKTVFNQTVGASQIEELKSFSLHLLLELILRSLCFNTKNELPEECPFSFNFSCINSISAEKSENVTEESRKLQYLMEKQEDVLKILQFNEQTNSEYLWVHMHALKTLFRNLNKVEIDYAISLFDKVSPLCKVAIQYISSNTSLEMLCSAMEKQVKFNSIKTDGIYVDASWGIDETYLTFIIYYYWTDFERKISSIKLCTDTTISSVNEFMLETGIKAFQNILCTINPLLSKSSAWVQNIDFLLYILRNNFPCAQRAGEVLLSDPCVLNDNIISSLNSCYTFLDVFQIYPLLVNAVMELKDKNEKNSMKFELLTLLYRMLAQSPSEIYDEVLKYIIFNFGHYEDFSMPEFSSQVKQLQCKALSIEEAKTILLPLFIQSPEMMLNYVVEEVLLQGYEGEVLIQVLKFIPSSCTYKYEYEESSPLIDILKSYFEKDELTATEAKNLSVLVKLLLKVNLETKIFSLDTFFNACILLNLESTNRIELILDCLNTSLEVLKDADNVPLGSSCLKDLFISLGTLINICIDSEMGKIKGLAARAIELLNDLELKHKILNDEFKMDIREALSNFHPAVIVYIDASLKKDIDFSKLPITSLWILCCASKTTSFLDEACIEKLSYTDLLNTLIQLLPHFSSSEWLHSVDLIKLCMAHSSLAKEALQNVDLLFEFSEEHLFLYASIKCLIESVGFLLQDFVGDLHFLCSCFTNTLMTTIKEEKCINFMFLLNLFLDLCSLVSNIGAENFSLFSSALIDLAKMITSTSDAECLRDTEEIIIQALKHLPDAEQEDSLLQKLIRSLK
ncbi:uncharacterized protein LOC129222626 [Uloborus diversus]|uniref:uncharacterized protein LOC129222626 n=1 Tax=Uloborus diversus TaxID=327109 RepID=UPI00240A7194|nr:uncharacterized protein LOC129222626 [Uloborus diversus]